MNLAHTKRGTIVSMSAHHDGKHVNVTVKHGKKKPKSKDEGTFSYDDRPSTDVMLAKEHADQYAVGDRVHVGMSPVASSDPLDSDDGEATDADNANSGDGEGLASLKKSAASGLHTARR